MTVNKTNMTNEILKKYFGYDQFLPGQAEIVEHILKKQDCLGIMPTGAGKSICYQVPAMCLSGVTVVISPLISLMKDQVDSLRQAGIPATYVNSSLSTSEYSQTLKNIHYNVYKIIYVAPERFYSDTFINLLNTLEVSMIAIDEAHCVSQWGHDFRPSYSEISKVIDKLHTRPIVAAFTATATQIVKDDIIKLLHLQNPYTLTTGFNRENLYLEVQTLQNKMNYLLRFLEEHKGMSGIIYCLTRKKVDEIYEFLSENGYNVSKYHAGMSESARSSSQDNFVYDRCDIMIATNAFGMGIDKSNVRYVIHYNMPSDLESYYQEAGRAGRDGDKAECVLLFNRSDIMVNRLLIEHSSEGSHANEYAKLNDMINYCNTTQCLRNYILKYFGECPTFTNCDFCSNCHSTIDLTDITVDSQKIFSCIKRMNERFGANFIADVLKGSKTSKLLSMGFDKLSTYGIMRNYSKDTIRDLISFLTAEGYLQSIGDKYPTLSLTSKANEVLFAGAKVMINKKIEKNITPLRTTTNELELKYDSNLFKILRSVRKDIALENNVPPFVIFSDTSLKEMATYYPVTLENMIKISGVGSVKLETYGKIFINAIQSYVAEHHVTPLDIPNISRKAKGSIEETTSSLPKVESKMISYDLFAKDGKTISEIADIRGITDKTVEEHLLACYASRLPINLEGVVHTKFETQIYDAIQSCSTGKLREIKDRLPQEVSYFDIKYYLSKRSIGSFESR